MGFWRYTLVAEEDSVVCLGERVKKGTYRATITDCIPYSQITGALWATLDGNFHAVGVITHGEVTWHTFSLRDVARGVAKVPLEVEGLVGLEGVVYIYRDGSEAVERLRPEFSITLGGLRSRGWGRCRLKDRREVSESECELQKGELVTHIPERFLSIFGIRPIRPRYGYLFVPDAKRLSGTYERALFRGSLVEGPRFLLKEAHDGQKHR